MSSAFIADLDAVVSSDIRVKLNGEAYRLPGDAPSELLLRITLLSEELEGAVQDKDPERMLELREEISEAVEELFRLRNPSLAEGSINLSDSQVGELVAKLFQHYYGTAVADAEREAAAERPTPAEGPAEPEAEEEPPTPQRKRSGRRSPTRSGTGSRGRGKSARSRSSASSQT